MITIKNILQKIKNMQTETITNENGTAIKFADGTMICTLQTKVTDQAINGAYGNLFQGTRVWDFPVAFIETPSVTCGCFQWGTGASWGGIRGISSTSVTLRGYDIASRSTGTETTISAIAIGRWK